MKIKVNEIILLIQRFNKYSNYSIPQVSIVCLYHALVDKSSDYTNNMKIRDLLLKMALRLNQKTRNMILEILTITPKISKIKFN